MAEPRRTLRVRLWARPDSKSFVAMVNSSPQHPMYKAFDADQDHQRLTHLLNNGWLWSNSVRVDHIAHARMDVAQATASAILALPYVRVEAFAVCGGGTRGELSTPLCTTDFLPTTTHGLTCPSRGSHLRAFPVAGVSRSVRAAADAVRTAAHAGRSAVNACRGGHGSP